MNENEKKEVFSINVSGFSAQEKQNIKIAAVKANQTLGEYCHDLLVKQS